MGRATHLLILRKLIVGINAVAIDIIGVDGIASDLISQGNTALDKLVRGSVLDINPSLVGELRPLSAEKSAICRCIPRAVIIAVARLHKAGIEVANDGDVARGLCLGSNS